MSQQPTSHIEPSRHSTKEVDEKLRQVERNIDSHEGAGSPAIKPSKDIGSDGKAVVEPNKPTGAGEHDGT
jgi:hypothetical protein